MINKMFAVLIEFIILDLNCLRKNIGAKIENPQKPLRVFEGL
jgi:hypothetical protein